MTNVIYLNEWKRVRLGAPTPKKRRTRWTGRGKGTETPTSIGELSAELLRLLKE